MGSYFLSIANEKKNSNRATWATGRHGQQGDFVNDCTLARNLNHVG